MAPAIYASDPGAAPDSEFVAGELRHLVAGNRGRLLDARRTPLSVTAVRVDKGAFEVEIQAFEDAGARWELPLEDVARLQFARDAGVADGDLVAELERARISFDRELVIECDPQARARTLERIAAVTSRLRLPRVDLVRRVEAREGHPELFALLDEALAMAGVSELEHPFAARVVSNPRSGELVKGHAIVLAELGLCPYRGKVVRDPELFAGSWSKERRAAHIVTRLGFLRALLADQAVTLFRGAAVEGPLPARSPSSFVSATFSRDVAAEHFEGGPNTETAVLWRQLVPAARLFMTFLETREMSERFREAEAVLVGEPGNRAF